MRRLILFAVLTSAILCPLWGQTTPYIFYRGVYNAASFIPSGLPGAAIARGSIFTIFGRNLGPPVATTASFPIASTLSGTALEVCAGTVCQPVLPLFVSASQVNAILPSNAPLGRVTLRARVNGVNSNFVAIDTVAASPGLFAINAAGFGPGIVQNFVSPTLTPINSLGNAAEPGQSLVLYGTGLGGISAADNQPAPAGNVGSVEVLVGDQVVQPAYAGRAPGFAGLDQVNFTVPASTPQGCYVPLRIRSNGRTTSNTVTISIGQQAGQRCEDGHNPLTTPIALGKKIAAVLPQRLENRADIAPHAPFDFLHEWLLARIGQPAPNDFAYSPLSLPPPGTCGAFTQSGNLLDGDLRMPVVADPATALQLRLTGSRSQEIDPLPNLVFSHVVNLTYGLASAVQGFFASPEISVSAEGIQGRFPAPRALTLSNPTNFGVVDRGRALRLNWTGTTGADRAIVALGAYDEANHASALVACLSRAGENGLEIPSALLETLPLAPPRVGRYSAVLALGRLPTEFTELTAPGFEVTLGWLASWATQNIWLEGGTR